MATKQFLTTTVHQEAITRISRVFDDFPRIYLSFSAGKDSTVMMHLVCEEARRRNREIGVLMVDLEAQYKMTIEHAAAMFDEYSDCIQPYWLALPLNLRNAVSQFEPQWECWDPLREEDWVREKHPYSTKSSAQFPWFRKGMEFEELVPAFGEWYAQGQLCACFVGIRCDESLNRWRAITRRRNSHFERLHWTTRAVEMVYNCYPLYDWRTRDVWVYHGKTGKRYNPLYDRMHRAGLTIHQQRICQPYGDDQRRGLWLYQIIEPDSWARVVARVNGANQGALYAGKSGNILGNMKVSKPENHTWQTFSHLLLESMPTPAAEHYRDKIAVFLKWYQERGFPNGIPDEGLPTDRKSPSWTRICKVLLRNDYWCKGLSFSQHKTEAFEKYQKLMKKRRQQWNII